MNVTRSESAWASDLYDAACRIWGEQLSGKTTPHVKGGRLFLLHEVEIHAPSGLFRVFQQPIMRKRMIVCIRSKWGGELHPLEPDNGYVLELYDRSQVERGKKLGAYLEADTGLKVEIELHTQEEA